MRPKNVRSRFKFKVAETAISIKSKGKNLYFRVPAAYHSFITRDNPEVEIEVCRGSVPEYYLKQRIFETGTTWTLYHHNGKRIVETPSVQQRSRRPQIAVLDSDFRRGKICIPQSRRGRLSGRKALNCADVVHVLKHPFGEILTVNLLARGRGVMVHACGIMDDGHGFLFVGASGAGKSTMANLWKRKEGAVILSDDRIIIHKKKGRFWIYGTPWHGDAKTCSPERAPLEKIFFLKHTENNIVKKINPVDAVSRLIACSFPTFWDKEGMAFTLSFCSELARNNPSYELGFVPDENVLEFTRD